MAKSPKNAHWADIAGVQLSTEKDYVQMLNFTKIESTPLPTIFNYIKNL